MLDSFTKDLELAHIKNGVEPHGSLEVWKITHDPIAMADHIRKEARKSEKVRESALEIVGKMYNENGKNSNEYLTTKAFTQIAPFIDRISEKQLRNPVPGASWAEIDYSSAQGLFAVLQNIETSKEYDSLRGLASWGFYDLLKKIPWESNPASLEAMGVKMDVLMMEAYKRKEPMIYMYRSDDWANPDRAPGEAMIHWAAGASLLIPIPKDMSRRIEDMSAKTWEEVKKAFPLTKTSKISLPSIAAFFSVLSAGQEHISPVIAQAMEINGIEMFINQFAKVKDVWDRVGKMTGIKFSEGAVWLQISLFLRHEYGHLAVGELGIDKKLATAELEEQLTDFPASVGFIESNPKPLPVQVLLCENIYQLLTSNDKNGNKFKSYEETAVVTINSLVESGLVRLDLANGKIMYDVDKLRVEDFVKRMRSIHNGLIDIKQDAISEATTIELTPRAKILVSMIKGL